MSSDVFAIRCEGLGKRYLVPQRRSEGVIDRLHQHLREFTSLGGASNDDSFWALKDVSFEVSPGEVVGIVGRNGSGKSTLLKILSGVTLPTTGRAQLQGKVGSLLEVGTGFHPDMTGRENVFMAGALLGLRQSEIKSKLDQIIDFAGIERFIDTPVKRYSSGMYVRLAYAVASLLRSDILILDEVMAVGDAEFREKSQKNIEQMSRDGRTILFVSHNMTTVRQTCERAIILNKGVIVEDCPVEEAVRRYLRLVHNESASLDEVRSLPARVDVTGLQQDDYPRNFKTILWVETLGPDGPSRSFKTGDTLRVRIGYEMFKRVDPCYFTIFILNDLGERVLVSYSFHSNERVSFPAGGVVECSFDDIRLLDGTFFISIDFGSMSPQATYLDYVSHATQIVVEQGDYLGSRPLLSNQGMFAQRGAWYTVNE